MAGNKNSGRRRKPTAALKLHGTFNPSRHADRIAEMQPTGEPIHPGSLSGEAEWLWDQVVGELTAQGVTKRIDTAHLWSTCELWGLYRVSVEIAKADPTDKNARIAVVSYRAAFDSAASKIGLSPADRAKLTVEKHEERDEFAELLKNG